MKLKTGKQQAETVEKACKWVRKQPDVEITEGNYLWRNHFFNDLLITQASEKFQVSYSLLKNILEDR